MWKLQMQEDSALIFCSSLVAGTFSVYAYNTVSEENCVNALHILQLGALIHRQRDGLVVAWPCRLLRSGYVHCRDS